MCLSNSEPLADRQLTTRTRAARRRDQVVVCPSCGRRVLRKSRQQTYCSTRCRKRGLYAENVRRGVYNPTGGRNGPVGTNPPKKADKHNALRLTKTQSNPRINAAPREVIEAELFADRRWRSVTSADGVCCEVAGSASP